MSYNGWTNYETWVVKLWMDNDESTYRHWQERTRDLCHNTPSDSRAHTLAEQLKEEHEDALPELTGFVPDLLNAALRKVNWYEIAQSLLRDYTDSHPEDIEEDDDHDD